MLAREISFTYFVYYFPAHVSFIATLGVSSIAWLFYFQIVLLSLREWGGQWWATLRHSPAERGSPAPGRWACRSSGRSSSRCGPSYPCGGSARCRPPWPRRRAAWAWPPGPHWATPVCNYLGKYHTHIPNTPNKTMDNLSKAWAV